MWISEINAPSYNLEILSSKLATLPYSFSVLEHLISKSSTKSKYVKRQGEDVPYATQTE